MEFETTVVKAKSGTYTGKKEGNVCSFLGVPFAKAERWKRAKVAAASDDVIDATAFGPSPWQMEDPMRPMPAGFSEDCLNLNLYCVEPEKPGKTVMVWIYGGAQVGGNNIGQLMEDGSVLLDGRKFAALYPDVVLVVPNYRVGILGSANLSFFPDYTEEYRFANNLARLDILECLRWVRENIEAFGGDPENVTLFGQSAGSNNITCQMLMPEAKGYFKRAICESSFAMDISLTKFEHSVIISKALFDEKHITTLRDALALSPEEVMEAQNALVSRSMGGNPIFKEIPSKLFSPVVDEAVIASDYWQYLQQEGAANVDYLGGTNVGEYDQQFVDFPAEENWDKARAMVLDHCRGKLEGHEEIVDQFVENYRETRTPFVAYKDLKGDIYLRMGAISYAKVFAEKGASSWLYFLQEKEDAPAAEARCAHAAEIPMLFCKPNPTDEALQNWIRDAWVSFARTGNPNAESLTVEWKQFDGERSTMVISDNTRMVPGVRNKDTELLLPLLNEYGK